MPPHLSIIVPILHEAATLPHLFATLAAQRDSDFELILCDGGSGDDSLAVAAKLAATVSFPCRILSSVRGRAQQMNAGAAVAQGELLLFLHADSVFVTVDALACAVACLRQQMTARGHNRLAGRFRLRFCRSSTEPSLAYAYYEYKAQLDWPGCIHGDQGFLLLRDFFTTLGGYDDALPILEDDRLADAVRRQGEWLLLPATIATSARRFEQEGLGARQLVNALLLTLAACEQQELLQRLLAFYRPAPDGRLNVEALLAVLDRELAILPVAERRKLWRKCGRYLLANLWQLPCWLDVRRAFLVGTSVTVLWQKWSSWLPVVPPAGLWLAVPVGGLGWSAYRVWRRLLRFSAR